MEKNYRKFQRLKGGVDVQEEELSEEHMKGIYEIAPTLEYLNYGENFQEEFEDKLYELIRDKTDDHFLLLEVISGVCVMGEKEVAAFKSSTRFS